MVGRRIGDPDRWGQPDCDRRVSPDRGFPSSVGYGVVVRPQRAARYRVTGRGPIDPFRYLSSEPVWPTLVLPAPCCVGNGARRGGIVMRIELTIDVSRRWLLLVGGVLVSVASLTMVGLAQAHSGSTDLIHTCYQDQKG